MKASIVCFTEHGAVLARSLGQGFERNGIQARAFIRKRDAAPPEGVAVLETSLGDWTREQFEKADALVFIGAAGIAVRSIAPWVRSKKEDPAVIVVDEQGRHAISLLSGHIGGANELTLLTARLLGAEPVITTATDLHGKFAVDSFAARRGLYMDSMEQARRIAAELVAGHFVGMYSRFPVEGRIPEELKLYERLPGTGEEVPETGFCVSVFKERPFAGTLRLVPKILTLGIGCRKGTELWQIEQAAEQVLSEYQIFPESVCAAASIDLKKEEEGLLAFAQKLRIPFRVFSAEELSQVKAAEPLAESAFVRQTAGVGNVCGLAALRASGARKLLIPKTIRNGVTVAAALAEYTVRMED